MELLDVGALVLDMGRRVRERLVAEFAFVWRAPARVAGVQPVLLLLRHTRLAVALTFCIALRRHSQGGKEMS